MIIFLYSCNHYGEKLEFNKGQLYYTEKVKKEDARKLGEWLVKAGFFDGTPKTVQLDMNADTFLFRMVIKEEAQNSQNTIDLLQLFIYQISTEVFNGKVTNAHICNDRLKTIKVVYALNTYGNKKTFNAGDVYYTSSVSDSLANKLGEYLMKNGFFDGSPKSVQINFENDTFQFKMVLKPELLDDAKTEIIARGFGSSLSLFVFDKKPVQVHYCDATFNTLKIIR